MANKKRMNSNESVRVYEVLDSVLQLDVIDAALAVREENFKRRGETVTSLDFVPATLEQRYLESGAIVLKEKTTAGEWQKTSDGNEPSPTPIANTLTE